MRCFRFCVLWLSCASRHVERLQPELYMLAFCPLYNWQVLQCASVWTRLHQGKQPSIKHRSVTMTCDWLKTHHTPLHSSTPQAEIYAQCMNFTLWNSNVYTQMELQDAKMLKRLRQSETLCQYKVLRRPLLKVDTRQHFFTRRQLHKNLEYGAELAQDANKLFCVLGNNQLQFKIHQVSFCTKKSTSGQRCK